MGVNVFVGVLEGVKVSVGVRVGVGVWVNVGVGPEPEVIVAESKIVPVCAMASI